MSLKDLILLKWIAQLMFFICKAIFQVLRFTGAWLFFTLFPALILLNVYGGAFVLETLGFTTEELSAVFENGIHSPISFTTDSMSSSSPAGLDHFLDWCIFFALIPTAILTCALFVRSLARLRDPGWTYRRAIRQWWQRVATTKGESAISATPNSGISPELMDRFSQMMNMRDTGRPEVIEETTSSGTKET